MTDTAASLRTAPVGLRLGWRITPLRLAAALTLLALAVRLTGLTARPLWLDETFSAWFASHSFDYLWHVLPTYEAHPPFYYSLLKLWRMAFGTGALAGRSLSVLLGSLTIPVIVAAALEQERQSPTQRPLLRAGLAGFLAACSPMLIVIGQETRPYPLLVFAYAVAILGLLRLIREFRGGGAGEWPSWLLLGSGTELVLWSHSLGVLYALCIAVPAALVWLERPMSRTRLVRGGLVASAIALLYAPGLLLVMSRANDWGDNWLRWQPDMLLQLVVLYTVPVEALTVGSAIAALAMALLIKRALSSAYVSHGWNCDRVLLLLWFGPPMLAALISAFFMPVFLMRTLAGTLIPAYLMIAGAIARSDDARERRIITAALCITLVPTALQTAMRPAAERWDLVDAFVSSHVSSADQLWLYPADSALPLDAIGGRIAGKVRPIPETFPTLGFKGPIRAGWRATVSLTSAQAAGFANDPAIRGVPVIWLVTRQSAIFDPDGDLPKALARVRSPGPAREWGAIAVRPYYRHGHLFDKADANRDGRVSLAEAQALALAHFDRADVNHEGVISPGERQQGRTIGIQRRPG